ncbi:hypothetical protein GCM10023328_46970 [Modestobacter marinus]|uniref:Uncharacterized protein n=2 Tax=Modestobacter marinus TaxID=477641 RepID=A0ABQ2GBS3_9ACTN|nr:hypothetical protein GCM10011589_46740 [Modestobacter marinus]
MPRLRAKSALAGGRESPVRRQEAMVGLLAIPWLLTEAEILLLAAFRHWLPLLQAADLISVEDDPATGDRCAQIQWEHLQSALATGDIFGSSGELRVLRAAASLVDGQPINLGDVASSWTAGASPCCWPRSPTSAAATNTAKRPPTPPAA